MERSRRLAKAREDEKKNKDARRGGVLRNMSRFKASVKEAEDRRKARKVSEEKKAKDKTKPLEERGEVGPPPPIYNRKKDNDNSVNPKKDSTEGGRYASYPGEISQKEGYESMYEVDRNKMSDEIRERLEEAELYEGDFKGGRVGKGKKKKVSKAPRGVRAAMRGFKPNMGASKVSKRAKGTGGGWI